MNEIEIIPEQENIVVNVEGVKDYNLLTNKPSINDVELTGNKSLEELGIQPTGDYALRSEIPTKLTQLQNDGDFVTDANYVHTDNNFTTGEKEKLASLYNYDDSDVKADIEQNKKDIASNESEINSVKKSLQNYALVTETGNKISLTIDSDTYVMTLQLQDKNGNLLSTGSVDLPLETMVVGASYDDETKEIILTLKNGTTVSFSVADLVDGLVSQDTLNSTLQDYALKTELPTDLSELSQDSTHRLVTDTEKATWNNKVDKVEGKGLSTNDFTNELKSKLDGIEDNAQVNKIEKISIDGVEQEIVEKEVNIKSYDINKYFYNALTYNNAKGNDLTFEDGIEFPLGKLDMEGKSEQVTTTGKNLLNLDFTTNPTTVGGANFTYENNKFTIKGTPTRTYSIFKLKNIISIIDGENYTFSANVNGTNPKTQIALKAYNNDRQVIFSIAINKDTLYKATNNISLNSQEISHINFIIEGLITGQEYDLSAEIQFEKGTEATDIEPYTGGQPSPSPDYPQEINSIEGDLEYVGYGSKNILNATRNEYTSNGITLSADTSKIYINGTPSTNDKIHTTAFKIPKGTYTLSLELISGSITSGTGALFQLYKDYTFNKVNKNDIIIYDSNKKNYVTFNLNEDTNINLSIYARTTETFTNAVIQYQITKGESADYDFVPFVEPRTLTIPTNGQVFRKIKDVSDKLIIDMKTGDYYKEKNIEELLLNNDTAFNPNTAWNKQHPNIFHAFTNLRNKMINKKILCNKFIDSSLDLGSEIIFRGRDNKSVYIFIKSDRLNSYNIGGLKEWIVENNVIFNYVLETPTLEKLGTLTKEQLDTLVTFKGYNNIMINTNLGQADIDIEYVLDMKKYIDNKIAEISAQMI